MSNFLRNKTISKTTPSERKTPSPNSMLLPTNAQGSGFLLNTQQHCFQGKEQREELVQLRCLEKCCASIQFSQQFCPRLQNVLVTSLHEPILMVLISSHYSLAAQWQSIWTRNHKLIHRLDWRQLCHRMKQHLNIMFSPCRLKTHHHISIIAMG